MMASKDAVQWIQITNVREYITWNLKQISSDLHYPKFVNVLLSAAQNTTPNNVDRTFLGTQERTPARVQYDKMAKQLQMT